MAARKPYAAGRAAPAIGPLPRQERSGASADLANFGQTLLDIGQRLGEGAATEKAQKDVASGNFKPRDNFFASSQAYNRAGMEAYFDTLQTSAASEIDRIYQENRENPAGLETSLAGYLDGTEKGLNDSMPGLVVPFRTAFERMSRPYKRAVAGDFFERSKAARAEQTTQTLNDKLRQATSRTFVAGDSVQDVADVTLDRNDYTQTLDRAVAAGNLMPADRAKRIKEYDDEQKNSRALGKFDREMRAGRGLTALRQFDEDKAAIRTFGPDGHETVLGVMRSRLAGYLGDREARDSQIAARTARMQEIVTLDLAVKLETGQATMQDVVQAAAERRIGFTDLRSLSSMARGDAGDDPSVVLDIEDRVFKGVARRDEVMALVGKGLSRKTATGLLGRLGSDAASVFKSHDYTTAHDEIKRELQTTGPLQQMDQGEQARISAAMRELDDRVRAGEPPLIVGEDIVARYRPTPRTLDSYPRPRFGTKENLDEAEQLTVEAFEAGRITQAVFEREAQLLGDLREAAARREQARQAQQQRKDSNRGR